MLAPLALVQLALPLLRAGRPDRQHHLRRRRRALRGLGRLRLLEGGARAARRTCSPPSTPSCASTPSTRATCARRSTRRRSRARTSRTGPQPEDERPGPARADRRRPAERPLPRPRPELESVDGMSARRLEFALPRALEAHEPPEARGLARDEVRLMVATRRDGRLVHARFRELPDFLRGRRPARREHLRADPRRADRSRDDGSDARAAALDPTPTRRPLARRAAARRPPVRRRRRVGERLALPDGGARRARSRRYAASRRLWRRAARPARAARATTSPGTAGRSATRYVPEPWPLEAYQNVYALEPGSAEMPSAGRPFTPSSLTRARRARRPRRAARRCTRASPRSSAARRRTRSASAVPAADGAARQRRARLGRARHRRRHDRRARARDGRRAGRHRRGRARAGRRSSSRRSEGCARSTA